MSTFGTPSVGSHRSRKVFRGSAGGVGDRGKGLEKGFNDVKWEADGKKGAAGTVSLSSSLGVKKNDVTAVEGKGVKTEKVHLKHGLTAEEQRGLSNKNDGGRRGKNYKKHTPRGLRQCLDLVGTWGTHKSYGEFGWGDFHTKRE